MRWTEELIDSSRANRCTRLVMLVLAINVYMRRERSQSLRATRKLFAFSILYLFALFATLLAEVVFRALAPMAGGA